MYRPHIHGVSVVTSGEDRRGKIYDRITNGCAPASTAV